MKNSIRPLTSTWAPVDNLLHNRVRTRIVRTAVSIRNMSSSSGPRQTSDAYRSPLWSSYTSSRSISSNAEWNAARFGCRQTSTLTRTPCAPHHSSTGKQRKVELPTSLLRSFSTSSMTPSLNSPSTAPSIFNVLYSNFPRLRSQDTPGRITNRERRRPSPLFDRPKPPPPSPPPPSSRPPSTSTIAALIALSDRHLSRLPRNFVLYTILLLNFLVFASWMYASESLRKFSDPRPYIFLSKNFLSGLTNVREGRWWTMLTSCVSHEQLNHFLVNMVSLAFMAPPVLALTGPTTFVLLYFGAGMVSSIVSMIGKSLVPPEQKRGVAGGSGFSHGASGSVYAIMSTFACVHPTATFLIFFVIPAPAWACVSGIFAWDLWHAAKTPKGRTDSAGHVGGILAGIAFWRFGLRGVRLQ